MERPPEDGLPTRPAGPWVRDKLGILETYFPHFVKACRRKAPRWFYVDGLAGSGVNTIAEENNDRVYGSAMLALQTHPRFSHCVFLEKNERYADSLRLRAERVAAGRSVTRCGDVNIDLLGLMHDEVDRRAPILCVLDPEGIEVEWRTIEELSQFRVGRFRTELLILLNVDGISRLLPIYGIQANVEPKLDAFFPYSWRNVWKRREAGELIHPEDARNEYLEMYERGLRALGYHSVLRRPIRRGGRFGGLKYVLVFATDNEAGGKIMDHCFRRVFPREQQLVIPGFEPEQTLS